MQHRQTIRERITETPKIWVLLVKHADGRTTLRATEKYSERGLTEQCDCCART